MSILRHAWGGITLAHCYRAVVDQCSFHDSLYGFRWKSSASAITNSVIGGNRIEISPLQFYLEGPLRVEGVVVANNTFTGMGSSFSPPGSSGCTGGIHSGSDAYASGTCSGIVVANNTYQSPPTRSGLVATGQ